MKPFLLTPRAEQDVADIWDYIANDNIHAADRVLDALERAMHRLARIRASATCGKNWPTAVTVFLGLLVPDRLQV